jgi:hypothetical protein
MTIVAGRSRNQVGSSFNQGFLAKRRACFFRLLFGLALVTGYNDHGAKSHHYCHYQTYLFHGLRFNGLVLLEGKIVLHDAQENTGMFELL